MKKLLLFLLLSGFAFGQNKATDTLLVDGTQPATILKLSTHKIYIAQNKELQTPYILQKDDSFISAGIPDTQISIFGKNTENPNSFIQHLFDTEKLKNNETKEIIKNSDDVPIYIKKIDISKEKILTIQALYPLEKEFISVNMSASYKDEDDKIKRFYELRDIVEKGLMVLENYYNYRKD